MRSFTFSFLSFSLSSSVCGGGRGGEKPPPGGFSPPRGLRGPPPRPWVGGGGGGGAPGASRGWWGVACPSRAGRLRRHYRLCGCGRTLRLSRRSLGRRARLRGGSRRRLRRRAPFGLGAAGLLAGLFGGGCCCPIVGEGGRAPRRDQDAEPGDDRP